MKTRTGIYDNAYYTTGRRRASGTWHSRRTQIGWEICTIKRSDVGCGMGNGCRYWSPRRLCSGIDISARAEICRSRSGADIRQGSAESFRADRSDLVTCLGSLEHSPKNQGRWQKWPASEVAGTLLIQC
jgi:hypothetical protein